MDGKLAGKQIIIFFNDTSSSVTRKDGFCSRESNLDVELDNSIIIPRNKIVRIEVQNGL